MKYKLRSKALPHKAIRSTVRVLMMVNIQSQSNIPSDGTVSIYKVGWCRKVEDHHLKSTSPFNSQQVITVYYSQTLKHTKYVPKLSI
jgi:hypothetical protein